MVDGVHGYVDHVLRHVVEEYRRQLEHVTIPHLPVEEMIVQAQLSGMMYATLNVALVRTINTILCSVLII